MTAPVTAGEGPLIYLVAGEPSGDLLGARLMDALTAQTGGRIRFAGIGGPNMIEKGLKSLFPIDELAVMGLVEIIPHVFKIYRRIRQTVATIRAGRPDAVVTIDSPNFTLEVCRRLKGSGIPLIHFVAPQVWAWKSWRAKKIAGQIDLLLALLPFEPPYFEKHGLRTVFVGHPAIEAKKTGSSPHDQNCRDFRERHGIPADARLVCVLPGSRRGEVTRILPAFAPGLARLRERLPHLHVVLPMVANTAEVVRAETAGWSIPVTLVQGRAETQAAFRACEAALAASGTVSVELAVAGVPTVIGYRVSAVSSWIARHVLHVNYVSLPNILLDRKILPELLQGDLSAESVSDNLEALLRDGTARQTQIEGFREVVTMLTPPDDTPSNVAARQVLAQIGAGVGAEA